MLSLFFALFAACDNGDGSGITSAEDIRQYSFEVFLESRIIPDSAILSIYSENHLLENTVKTIKNCFNGSKCLFETAPLKYGDHAKITVFAHSLNDSIKMEFSRMAPMKAGKQNNNEFYTSSILNIYTAAASKAVEYNLQEKLMSYEAATQAAYKNMKDFGIDDRNFESDQFNPNISSMSPIQLPYVYCRYFLSDSVFYNDFLELQDAIRDGEWGDTLFRVRAADALVRTFKNMSWDNVPGINIFYNYHDFYPNFWESIYGMEVCNDNHIGDTLVNANRRSEFYDSVFVCAGRMLQGGIKWQHWRIREPEEAKMGICNPFESMPGIINKYNPQVGEIDSVIYTCEIDGWKETNNIDFILRYWQIPCNQEMIHRAFIYKDSLYLCQAQKYSDEEWPMAYLYGARQNIYYAWTGDQAVIDSVYPGEIPSSALLKNVKGVWE